MLRLSALILYAFIILSCNKTSSPDPQPVLQDSFKNVLAYMIEQPQENHTLKQTFRYDQEGNLISLHYQSEHVGPYEILDSGTFSFTYEPVTRLMNGYTMLYRKFDDTEYNIGKHVLLYDNQKRVVADSTTEENGVPPQFSKVALFSYADPFVVMKTGKTSGRIDSLTVINGDVTWESFYTWQNAVTQPDYTDYFSPNLLFRNPFYDEKMPATIRTFLTQLWFNDWVSKDLPDWQSEKMTWAEDAKGRISSGIGDAGTKLTFVYE